MRIYTVFNNKGGVGKTTTAVNLAYNLTAEGKRVLIIDVDPQENATWFYKKLNCKYDVYKILQENVNVDKAIRVTGFENLDIIPGSARTELINGINGDVLKNALHDSEKVRTYDAVIIDCAPCMQIYTVNALLAADTVIIPVKPDKYSLVGLSKISDAIKREAGEKKIKVLITNYKSNKNNNQIVAEIIQSGYDIFDSVIRYGVAADSSESTRKPLTKHRAKAKITEDYIGLAEELAESLEK